MAFLVSWTAVVLAFASVWKSARTMGLSTWWLGPPGDPQFTVVQLVPFIGPIALIIAASAHARFLPYWGAIAAVGLGAIATGDLGRFERLAYVEFVAAAAGLLASVAASAGSLRSEPRIDRPVT